MRGCQSEEGATFLATKPIYILAGKKVRERHRKLFCLYELCDSKKEGKHAWINATTCEFLGH
jgi:hypothetical protein